MRRLIIICLGVLLLTACGARQPRVPTVTPSDFEATAQPTDVPTNTPQPTATATATPTITPTHTSTPRPSILPAAFYYIGAFNGRLYRVEADGATESTIFNERIEAYTIADGIIYFVAEEVLYAHDMNTVETSEGGSAPAEVEDMLVSSSQESIIYLSQNAIFTSDLDGSNLSPLFDGGNITNPRRTDDPFDISFTQVIRRLTLSPDGTTLAFEYNGVRTMPVAGGEEPTLIIEQFIPNLTAGGKETDLIISYPLDWSPGGDYILFEVTYYEGSATTTLNTVSDEIIELVPPSFGGCCLYSIGDALYTVSNVDNIVAIDAFYFGVEEVERLFKSGNTQGFTIIDNIYAPANGNVYVTGTVNGQKDTFIIADNVATPLNLGAASDINVWTADGAGFLAYFNRARTAWVTAEGNFIEIEAGLDPADIFWAPLD